MPLDETTGRTSRKTETIDERYETIDVLAETKWATTRLVRDRESGAKLVVKSLPLEGVDDPKVVELFVREAEVLASLEHPRIPGYVDSFGTGEGQNENLHLVQQYIEGETLATAVEHGRRFTEIEAIEFAEELLEVLEFLHSQNPPIIHRDIKPSNVVLTEDGPALIDFGGARNRLARERGVDDDGFTIVGSYGYMPYEQFEGHAVPASDLYSLGVTLIYALAHKEPGDLDRDGMRLIFHGNVNISPQFEEVLVMLTEPEWKGRYQSVAEVRRALDEVRHPWRRKLRRALGWSMAALVSIAILWAAISTISTMRSASNASGAIEDHLPGETEETLPVVAPAAKLPTPSTRLVAEGRVLFDGEPITEVTHLQPITGVIDRDRNTQTAASSRYDNGKLSIYGLAPGTYSISLRFDANEKNPVYFPGDYYSGVNVTVTAEGVAAMEINVVKIIHLTSPWDNGVRSNDRLRCDRQKWISPIRFEWDEVLPDAEYVYRIDRFSCEPFERLETMSSGTISDTSFTGRLPISHDNEIYILNLDAQRDGRQVGYFVAHGTSWTGWDYRFRVASDGGIAR